MGHIFNVKKNESYIFNFKSIKLYLID